MATTVPSDPAAEINRYKERLNGLYDLVEEAVKLVDPNSTLIRTS
ncbi:MAG: hypothetical protein NTV94_11615 [Planctomycetota bacterium]|nr:hypothetical protein [Planctomycetota bacterium]